MSQFRSKSGEKVFIEESNEYNTDTEINVITWYYSTKLKKDTGIELFSGEFWSGRKSKELGLVDGIGHIEEILK